MHLQSRECAGRRDAAIYAGEQVVARELLTSDATTNAATATALQSLINECVQANVPPGPTQNTDAQRYAQSLFAYAFCDATAKLLAPGQVVAGPTDPTSPPTVGAGTCR